MKDPELKKCSLSELNEIKLALRNRIIKMEQEAYKGFPLESLTFCERLDHQDLSFSVNNVIQFQLTYHKGKMRVLQDDIFVLLKDLVDNKGNKIFSNSTSDYVSAGSWQFVEKRYKEYVYLKVKRDMEVQEEIDSRVSGIRYTSEDPKKNNKMNKEKIFPNKNTNPKELSKYYFEACDRFRTDRPSLKQLSEISGLSIQFWSQKRNDAIFVTNLYNKAKSKINSAKTVDRQEFWHKVRYIIEQDQEKAVQKKEQNKRRGLSDRSFHDQDRKRNRKSFIELKEDDYA